MDMAERAAALAEGAKRTPEGVSGLCEVLAALIAVRLDEDEALAKAATPGPWEFEGDDPTDDELYSTHDRDWFHTVAWTRDRQVANGRFMERFDPVRVLADVESIRALVAEITAIPHEYNDGDPLVLLLAGRPAGLAGPVARAGIRVRRRGPRRGSHATAGATGRSRRCSR